MLTASGDTINVPAGTVVTFFGIPIATNIVAVVVAGSGDTINAATLDNITASNDAINVAANATDTISGSNNTINVGHSDTLTVSGSSDILVFQPAFGQDVINGFDSRDTIQFSTADFANWQALLNHMTQSGSNTIITLDASDTVTLAGVTASTLQASQFSFR